MANIVYFTGKTSLPIDPDRVLEQAKSKLSTVIVIGYEKPDEHGEEIEYFSSSTPNGNEIVWLLQRMLHVLMSKK